MKTATVVRMQKQTGIIQATLIKDVAYEKDGEEVLVPAGTPVTVDVGRGVGCAEIDHFDLFPSEYAVNALQALAMSN